MAEPNKIKYVDKSGETPPVGTETGWMFSDAVINKKCPKCQSDPGFYCQSPKGAKVWPPHTVRMAGMDAKKYEAKMLTIDEAIGKVLARINQCN